MKKNYLYGIIYNRGGYMKNNKGFIATTLIYSFLLLFATLIVVIIGNYNYYRNTLNKYNKGVNDALNSKIDSKYVTLKNEIDNSDFEKNKLVDASFTNDPWHLGTPYNGIDLGKLFWMTFAYSSFGTGATYSDTTKKDGLYSLKFDYKSQNRTVSVLSNSFTCTAGSYYYVSYYVFTNGQIKPLLYNINTYPLRLIDYGKIGLYNTSISNWVVNENIDYPFQNWQKRGILAKAEASGTCNFKVDYLNNDSTLMYIDDVVVTDVTNIVKNSDLLVNDNLSTDNRDRILNIFNSTTKSGRIDYFSNSMIYNTDDLISDLG